MLVLPITLKILKTTLFAFIVFLSASIGAQNTLTNNVQPIRIAMIEGMSGAFANAGEAVLRNIRFAVEQVNALNCCDAAY